MKRSKVNNILERVIKVDFQKKRKALDENK
jgi:hypothetical protein